MGTSYIKTNVGILGHCALTTMVISINISKIAVINLQIVGLMKDLARSNFSLLRLNMFMTDYATNVFIEPNISVD